MTLTHEFGVVIGNFQPFHNAHHNLVKEALKHCERVILVLGSHRTAPSVRAPWSVVERETMIRSAFRDDSVGRIQILGVRDFLYNDAAWRAEVLQQVKARSGNTKPLLVGHFKNRSSAYLREFPEWDFLEYPHTEAVSGTAIRTSFFGQDPERQWANDVPVGVADYLSYYQGLPNFGRLSREQAHLIDYKERTQYKGANYAPSFVTVDAVVVQAGHILLIRRAGLPGEGLLALPGGFIEGDEWPQDAAVRELVEETGLQVELSTLTAAIKGEKVFAAPSRSQRGRTYSIAYLIDLGTGQDLPEVTGSDDAARAFWSPLADVGVQEAEFFEDHAEIIHHFVNRL